MSAITNSLRGKSLSFSQIKFNSTLASGKVAVVTGSSRSIGAAITKQLGAQGAKVVVNYVNDAVAAASVVAAIKSTNGGDAVAVQVDASTIAGGQQLVDEALKSFGGVDILVLNAGIMGSKVLTDVDEAFYDAHFAANVKGPFFLAKAAAPLIPTRMHPGSILSLEPFFYAWSSG